jgi:hypothetical protein
LGEDDFEGPLATAAGLFLTVSWLGLWLWLPPLGRATGVLAFAIIALAAAVPFVFVRVPAIADGRLDHGSGLRHRPATAIVDALAVTPSDSYSLALWNAHVERARAAAQAFKAGWPSPRVAGRDPYALRALVLIASLSSPPAASAGSASRRHSTGRAWCWRQTSASTRGSLRRPIPASRRSFSPASIPAKRRAPRMPPASLSPSPPAAPWSCAPPVSSTSTSPAA